MINTIVFWTALVLSIVYVEDFISKKVDKQGGLGINTNAFLFAVVTMLWTILFQRLN